MILLSAILSPHCLSRLSQPSGSNGQPAGLGRSWSATEEKVQLRPVDGKTGL